MLPAMRSACAENGVSSGIKAEEAEAVYRFVEDDQELDDLFQIFARLLDDADVEIQK